MTDSHSSRSEDTLTGNKDFEGNPPADHEDDETSHNESWVPGPSVYEAQREQGRPDLARQYTERDYTLVRWQPGEPENPYNWSTRRKSFIVAAGMLQVINSTLCSAISSGATQEIGAHFNITSPQQLVLPISTYLIGYVVGPLVFGPLSESFGRRWVMISSFASFTIWTMASALAPNFTALCLFRLFTGASASCPIVVIGGVYADLFFDRVSRGKAMAVFMACTTWGPTIAPVASGFVGTVSWRWPFWVALIFAGASFPIVACLPETYGPILLRNKARKLRERHPETKYLAKIELESTKIRDVVTRVLYRPISMLIHESIVTFTCLYLSLIYAIFYLFFEAYPIVFQDMYGLGPGVAGLAFIPIGVGSVVSLGLFLGWDQYLRKSQQRQKAWALQEECSRLPLALVGGPALSIGVLWLAWASWPWVTPIVPMLAGIPFGIGFLLIFMALINYLTDAYEIYAASALAATSTTRSCFGAVLPLAAEPMYKALGIHWATSLLGFASALMILVPIAFIRFGPYLREHSKFSLELKEIRAKEAREDERIRRANGEAWSDVEKEAEAQEKDADLVAGPSADRE